MRKNRDRKIKRWAKIIKDIDEDDADIVDIGNIADFTSFTMPLIRNYSDSGVLSDEGKKMIENFEFDCVLKRSKGQEELIKNVRDEFSSIPSKEKTGVINKIIDIYINVGSLDREFGQANKLTHFSSANDLVDVQPMTEPSSVVYSTELKSDEK